jgi:hypothetical protein
MCIMDIHADADTVHMVQACLHNADTVLSNLDMAATVLDARYGTVPVSARPLLDVELRTIRTAHANVSQAVNALRATWHEEIARHERNRRHALPHVPVGNEHAADIAAPGGIANGTVTG